MKKITMIKTSEGLLKGRMRRLLEGTTYSVINFLAEVLIAKEEAVLVKTKKKKKPTKKKMKKIANKAMNSFDNK